MQARRASRELSLILFSQFDKNIDKYKNEDFSSIILKSVRTLISSASEEINLCASKLQDMKNKIIDYENNHQDNLNRPIEVENIPVPIVLTSDFENDIDTMINCADKTLSALDIAELCTLSGKEEVKDYTIIIC